MAKVWNKGLRTPDDVRLKISSKLKGRCKNFSRVHCRNLSKALNKPSTKRRHRQSLIEAWKTREVRGVKGPANPIFGRRFSVETRKKMSRAHKGIKLSLSSRRKVRIAVIEQHKNNGISFPAVDKGATEFFNNLNQNQSFHIQHPNVYFPELGYFADGYDPVLHVWFEYDTKFHLLPQVEERDLSRQQEIIEHFQQIGKPLKAFYRINGTGRGESKMKNVMEGGLFWARV
jgi:hypothetical protein